MKTIQEVFNACYDSSNNLLNVSAGSGSEATDGTVQDILNKVFDSGTNTIKTSQ